VHRLLVALAALAAVVVGCEKHRAPAAQDAALALPATAPPTAPPERVDAGDAGARPTGDAGAAARCARVAESAVSRYGCTATVLTDGRVLLVGSAVHDAEGPYSPVVEIFDPTTHAVTKVAPLHTGRAKHAATRLADGRVLVVGGMSDEPGATFSRTGEVYDVAANTWTPIGKILEGAISQAIATLPDGRVVLAGGDAMYRWRKLDQVLALEPKTMRWSQWPNAPVMRAGTLEALGDGRLLFSGDASGGGPGDEPTTVAVLDPRSRAWTTLPSPLGDARVDRAVRLSDHELALFGYESVDGGSKLRIAVVDDALAHPRALPVPDGDSASGVAVDGVLYALAGQGQALLRFRAAIQAWERVATHDGDGCTTVVPLPARAGGPSRILFAGTCGSGTGGGAHKSEGALEVCEL
jgi:hypothetical protein